MNLVTGGTGHIGNVLIRELLARGEKVRTLVLPHEDRTALAELDNVEWFEGDVLNLPSLQPAFQGVENVYHLAGLISILPHKDDLVQHVNVQGTKNVISAAVEAGVRRLVYTSSIHALSRVQHGLVIDESVPFDPQNAISAYDRSKAEASLFVLEAARQGLDAVIVCPTGVIGPNDFRGSEMGEVIKDCMKNKLLFCVDGAYDFVDVRDVCQGEILACQKGRSGETYILSGERLPILSIMEIVREITGIQASLIKIPLKLAKILVSFMPFYYRLTRLKPRFTPYALATVLSNSNISHKKAWHELGYSPRTLRQSLADTVQWFKENNHLWK